MEIENNEIVEKKSGIRRLNGQEVHSIDGIDTIINNIKQINDNTYLAEGFIVNKDLTLSPTYVAKIDNYFAHGVTAKEAIEDANDKYQDNLSDEDRIELFLSHFNLTDKYSASEFSKFHKKLTGSCQQGRDNFMSNNNIKPEDQFTVAEFIEKTKDAYNSTIMYSLAKKIETL